MAEDKLDKICGAVLELTGLVCEAKLTVDGSPATEPPILPAVYVEWLYTEPTSGAYGVKSGMALNQSGKQRVHYGRLIVLTHATTQSEFATSEVRPVAQKLMSAFERDSTLQDVEGVTVANRCDLTRVEPEAIQWGETIYFGVAADWQAMELL